MILNLGCGAERMEDAVNVDSAKLPSVDLVHDLNTVPWPLPADRFERIFATDLIEHLDDPVVFLEECWRVASTDGVVLIQTVEGGSHNHYTDPTHKRGFTLESFDYFDPKTFYGRKFAHYSTGKWSIEHKSGGGENLTFVLRKVES